MGPILADPEVLRLTGSVSTTAEVEAATPELDQRTRTWYATRNEQTDRLDLAVVDRATGRCVGEVVLNEYRPEDDACNFRILVGPDGRDRGLGTEAARLVINHAFATTTLNRISLDVQADNPRARRSYEKVGFVVEGVLREEITFDGVRGDNVIMAVLRSDWERGRG
ncbi:GNAT family N-acetyltransferase [Serinibacter arcticus]|uniref:GNAT family N-acetyltransferase n=2 Tax=Serinibacter arcticus TaxID=1655435 RepID=A0A2U1ZZD7_9MICO|nr:GNAT family N-acetyltransferase [Serinibacter arcticus]